LIGILLQAGKADFADLTAASRSFDWDIGTVDK
jgi:hypothetical protein